MDVYNSNDTVPLLIMLQMNLVVVTYTHQSVDLSLTVRRRSSSHLVTMYTQFICGHNTMSLVHHISAIYCTHTMNWNR